MSADSESGQKPSKLLLLSVILLSTLVSCGVIGTLFSSCYPRPLRKSSHWFPTSLGGPIEVRPLPAADKLREDYREWISATNTPKVFLYSAILQGVTNQTEFKFKVVRGESPLGSPLTTFASFIYRDPTNGTYQLEWMEMGRQYPDLIRVTDKPRTFLLAILQTRDTLIPYLQIIAIEGVEWRGVLPAITRTNVP